VSRRAPNGGAAASEIARNVRMEIRTLLRCGTGACLRRLGFPAGFTLREEQARVMSDQVTEYPLSSNNRQVVSKSL